METAYSLQRHCYDNVCHCDWRLTLYGCVESNAVRIINIINITVSALASLIGIGLLFYRVIIKGHSFMDTSSRKGFLRPKPIDCMLLFLTIFNILRLVASIVLVADIAPDNLIFRSFLFEIAWQFGYSGFALYLIGISQALAESHKSISSSWLPPPRVVDAVGLTIFLAPFIINNPLSISAGVLAFSNLKVAEICTRVLYFSWFFNCSGLSFSVIYCGSRLAKTLENHLVKFNTTGQRYKKVKSGVFKIRAVMVLITVCCLMFACFLALYGILRTMIMKNFVGSLFLCTVWNMLGPTVILLVEAAIIFTPKVDKESSGIKLKSSTEERSTTLFETQNTMKGNDDVTFSNTLTNSALDDLKIKHDDALKNQYENKVFTSNLKNDNHYFYAKKSEGSPLDGFHVEESESEYRYYELERQNSKVKLIDKRY